jgi:hypothetical protein
MPPAPDHFWSGAKNNEIVLHEFQMLSRYFKAIEIQNLFNVVAGY